MADQFLRLCARGDLKGVQEALHSGADVNCQDHWGNTGLTLAVNNDNTAVATFLLEQKGIDVDITNNFGRCALYFASMHDRRSNCLALILARTDITTVNNTPSTPLLHAICWKASRNIELLISDARTDPNIKVHPEENSPIMYAVKMNYVRGVKILLADPRVDLSTRDNYRRSQDETDRFVAELKKPVKEVLEEELNSETSFLFRLGGVWYGGAKDDGVGQRILGELDNNWRSLSLQGRTLEEVAKAPCVKGFITCVGGIQTLVGKHWWECGCGSANGHPELAMLVQEERERRKAPLPTPALPPPSEEN